MLAGLRRCRRPRQHAVLTKASRPVGPPASEKVRTSRRDRIDGADERENSAPAGTTASGWSSRTGAPSEFTTSIVKAAGVGRACGVAYADRELVGADLIRPRRPCHDGTWRHRGASRSRHEIERQGVERVRIVRLQSEKRRTIRQGSDDSVSGPNCWRPIGRLAHHDRKRLCRHAAAAVFGANGDVQRAGAGRHPADRSGRPVDGHAQRRRRQRKRAPDRCPASVARAAYAYGSSWRPVSTGCDVKAGGRLVEQTVLPMLRVTNVASTLLMTPFWSTSAAGLNPPDRCDGRSATGRSSRRRW